MCGIGGVIALDEARLNPALIEELCNELVKHGHDATGALLISPTFDFVVKRSIRGWDTWTTTERQALLAEAAVCKAILIHTRAGTTGDNALVNTHPFEDTKKGIWLAHNGMIKNYGKIFQKYNYKGASDCDSIAMLLAYEALLEAGAGVEKLPSLNDEVDGWWNCWVYHALTNEIVLFSNMNGWRGGMNNKQFVFHNLGSSQFGERLPSFMKIHLRAARPYLRFYDLTPTVTDFDRYILQEDDNHIYIKVPENAMGRFVGWNNLKDDGTLKLRKHDLDEDKKKRILGIIVGG
jgi:hypothetical protein